MFGIYSRLIGLFPEGGWQRSLRSLAEAKSPSRPPYWTQATITHTMADSRRKFWINFLGAQVTCIDTWMNAAHGACDASEVEAHFDANVGGRVVKIKSSSTPALDQLARDNAVFD